MGRVKIFRLFRTHEAGNTGTTKRDRVKKEIRTTPPMMPSIYNTTTENWTQGRVITEAILEAISKRVTYFEYGDNTIRILDNTKNDREWIVRITIKKKET